MTRKERLEDLRTKLIRIEYQLPVESRREGCMRYDIIDLFKKVLAILEAEDEKTFADTV